MMYLFFLLNLLFSIYFVDSSSGSTTTTNNNNNNNNIGVSEFLKCRICESRTVTGAVDDCFSSVESVDFSNSQLYLPLLHKLTRRTFFRYFKVDLYRSCPFWPDDGTCARRDCSVCECDPNEVPTCWEEERKRENKFLQARSGDDSDSSSSLSYMSSSTTSSSSSSLSSTKGDYDDNNLRDETIARLSRVNFSVSRSDAQSHSFGWSEEGYSHSSSSSTTSSTSSVDDDKTASSSTRNNILEDSSLPTAATKMLSEGNQQQHQQKNMEQKGHSDPSLRNVWTVQEGEGGGDMAYVNLLANPEGYTGYSGPAAEKVWKAIYNENCFNTADQNQKVVEVSLSKERVDSKGGENENINKIDDNGDKDKDGMCYEERIFFRLISGLQASINTHIAMTYGNGAASETDVFSSHDIDGSTSSSPSSFSSSSSSSSSTTVVSHIFSFFNTLLNKVDSLRLQLIRRLLSLEETSNSSSPKNLILTPGLEPSVELYVNRIGKHPDRIKNLYFTFLFVVRAINKARGALLAVNFSTGNPFEDDITKEMVMQLTSSSSSSSSSSLLDGFDERSMFKVRTDELIGSCALPNVLTGEEDLAELHRRFESEYRAKRELRESLRRKFHNISRIMDCVGCEKCRLWGKLQFLGLGTAMKILFAEEESSGQQQQQQRQQPSLMHFTRNEVVALLTLLHRLSVSIAAVHVVRDLEAQNKVLQASSFIASAFFLLLIVVWLFRRAVTQNRKKNKVE